MLTDDVSLPIHGIPMEVLALIFLNAVAANYRKRQMLLVISWVCRRWREIALGTPRLWNKMDINSDDLSFMAECVLRSKGIPLAIKAWVHEPGLPPLVDAVLHHLPNTEELQVYGYDEGEPTSSTDRWNTPAPILKVLDISYCQLPDDLFAGSTPSLRKLSLDCSSFTLSAFPPCQKLRSLSLSHVEGDITVYDFLERLQDLPRLQSLELLNAIGREGSNPYPNRVHLPHLIKLRAKSEWFASMDNLLNHLTIPAIFDLSLELEETPNDHVQLIQTIQQCRNGSAIKPTSLRAVVSEDFQDYSIDETNEESHTFSLHLRLSGDTTIEMVERTCQALSLHNLEELDIDEADPPLNYHWSFWNSFSSLPKLHTLRLANSFVLTFIRHFFDVHDAFMISLPQEPSEEFYATLRTYAVQNLGYPALKTMFCAYISSELALKQHLEFLGPGLSVRRVVGLGLDELTLTGQVNWDDEVIKELQKAVAYVDITQP